MKSRHFVRTFFFAGLVFAVTAMVSLPVGSAYADSSDGGNAVEQLIGGPPPEILKSVSPDTLKAIMDAAEAGNIKASAPDGAAAPRAAGNKDVVLPVNSTDFHVLVPPVICNIWFFGQTTTASICPIATGINLPDGAVIYRLEMTAMDNSATDDVSLIIERVKKDGIALEQVAILNSSGQSTDIKEFSTTTILIPTVDNQNYSYFLASNLFPDTFFFAGRVWYHPHTDLTVKTLSVE